MRTLVVGTTPPPGGSSARRLAGVAARRRELGDEVTVLSPDVRSAAHRSARLDGVFLALQLAACSPRHDALELHVEPGLPFGPRASRLARDVVLLALGLALGRFGDVTLRFESPIPLPGGVGGRATNGLWRHVTRVVVENEADRSLLLALPAFDPARISVEPSTPVLEARTDSNWPSGTDPMLHLSVLDEIRRGAAAERALRAARLELGQPRPPAVSAFGSTSPVRPSLKGAGETIYGAVRRRAAAFAQRQRELLAARSR